MTFSIYTTHTNMDDDDTITVIVMIIKGEVYFVIWNEQKLHALVCPCKVYT